jgi:hypothetical protein
MRGPHVTYQSSILTSIRMTLNVRISCDIYQSSILDLIIISLKINLFSPWSSWKIAELVLNNNHWLTPNHFYRLIIKGFLYFLGGALYLQALDWPWMRGSHATYIKALYLQALDWPWMWGPHVTYQCSILTSIRLTWNVSRSI